jgi:hypothetical protein
MSTNDATYTGLIALRDKLDQKHAELKRELDIVTRQLESVSTTLELLDEANSEQPNLSAELEGGSKVLDFERDRTIGIDVAGLHGLTQIDALKKIAQHSGGTLYLTVAKQILLKAGLISNPKNANNIVFSVVQRSGAFERLDRGLYRLINKPIRPMRP